MYKRQILRFLENTRFIGLKNLVRDFHFGDSKLLSNFGTNSSISIVDVYKRQVSERAAFEAR